MRAYIIYTLFKKKITSNVLLNLSFRFVLIVHLQKLWIKMKLPPEKFYWRTIIFQLCSLRSFHFRPLCTLCQGNGSGCRWSGSNTIEKTGSWSDLQKKRMRIGNPAPFVLEGKYIVAEVIFSWVCGLLKWLASNCCPNFVSKTYTDPRILVRFFVKDSDPIFPLVGFDC